jgi:hypothetical protein
MKVRQAAQDRTDAALAKWDTAVLASKDAEIEALHAKVEERNAYVSPCIRWALPVRLQGVTHRDTGGVNAMFS